MTARVNYYKIGILVLGALSIAVFLILALGSGYLFYKESILETYFNESVQGLSIGSKVKYRGVIIGEVSRIAFSSTQYEKSLPPTQRKRYVLVEATMRPESLVQDTWFSPNGHTLSEEIARGLRIRLASQGITGTSYLEIDYVDPAHTLTLPISWRPMHYYLPSSPSKTTQFMKSFEKFVDRLQALDVEGALSNWNRFIISAKQQVDGINASAISAQANRILTRADKIPLEHIGKDTALLLTELKNISHGIKILVNGSTSDYDKGDLSMAIKKLRDILDSPGFNQTLSNLERSMQYLERMMATGESDIKMTFENLQQLTSNLRDLTEIAKYDPSSIIFGSAPNRVTGK